MSSSAPPSPFAHIHRGEPTDSIAQSVRALNDILAQLSGKEAVAAFLAGDSCARVDQDLFAAAFEGARNLRDHWLLTLARTTRDQWRSDVREIMQTQPQFNQAAKISQALDARLQITLDFAFRFLARRHVTFLGDALMLAFEPHISPAEMSKELATSASRSRNRSDEMLDALVLGASQMHRYQPERVLSSAKSSGGYA